MKIPESVQNILVVTVAILAAYGYLANLISIFTAHSFTGEVLLRCIGVFILPLGAILGFV